MLVLSYVMVFFAGLAFATALSCQRQGDKDDAFIGLGFTGAFIFLSVILASRS